MKRLLLYFTSAIVITVTACTSKIEYKEARRKVVVAHDSVMVLTERSNQQRRILDSLLKNMHSLYQSRRITDTLYEKQLIHFHQFRLAEADEQMDKWMLEFDAEVGSKSNEEALNYFKKEEKKMAELGTLYKIALKESGEYLDLFR